MLQRVFFACAGLRLNEVITKSVQENYFNKINRLIDPFKEYYSQNTNTVDYYFYNGMDYDGKYTKLDSSYRGEFKDAARTCNIFVAFINDFYLDELQKNNSNCSEELTAFIKSCVFDKRIITVDLRDKESRQEFKDCIIKLIDENKNADAILAENSCKFEDNSVNIDLVDEDDIKNKSVLIQKKIKNLLNVSYKEPEYAITYVDCLIGENYISYSNKKIQELTKPYQGNIESLPMENIQISPKIGFRKLLVKRKALDLDKQNSINLKFEKKYLEDSKRILILCNHRDPNQLARIKKYINRTEIKIHCSKLLFVIDANNGFRCIKVENSINGNNAELIVDHDTKIALEKTKIEDFIDKNFVSELLNIIKQ